MESSEREDDIWDFHPASEPNEFRACLKKNRWSVIDCQDHQSLIFIHGQNDSFDLFSSIVNKA